MSWLGSLIGASSAYETGDDKRDAAYDEARQMDQQAEQEVAVGTFNVERLKKRAAEIRSSQKAKSAAYGQSSTDATSMAIDQETVQNASMDQLIEMAMAEERARTLRKDAEQTRLSGEYTRREYRLGGTATIIGGINDMARTAATFGMG